MLPSQKRRALRSIALGAVLAGLTSGFYYLQSLKDQHKLRVLVADCERSQIETPPPKGFVLDRPLTDADFAARTCDAEALAALPGLVGRQAELAEADRQVYYDKDCIWSYPLAAFLIFCLPLGWYWLLDRIREVGDAIAGRNASS
jgi:hypothetical protein